MQDFGQAAPRFQPKEPMQPAPMQIDIHQQNPLARLGKTGRKIGAGGGFALLGNRRGDRQGFKRSGRRD